MPNPADKPFAAAAEENKQPILGVIEPLFQDLRTVLEIGSGTGQHAVFFAARMPHLLWQTSDLPANHAGIRAWIADSRIANVLPPLTLDVTGAWPPGPYDAVFSANTAHILSFDQVAAMFRGVARVLAPAGLFAIYGPFNYGGRHTSESNARFDQSLRARNPASGLKDVDDLEVMARAGGMELSGDFAMPVNNRTLVWRRR